MTSPTNNVIKIFQFWNTKKVPGEVERMMRSWRNHPNYRLQLYSYPKAKAFIKRNFDEQVFDAFCQCRLPAMQADFFRYCALYQYGGMYVDADIKLGDGKFDDLNELIQSSENGLIMTREKAIANDVIFIRKPKSPLIKYVIEKVISNIENKVANNVWQVTGPGIMSTLYKDGSPKEKALFEPHRVESYKIIRNIVEFKWNLNYKEGDGHWTSAQESQSIFKYQHTKTKPKVFCIGFNKTGTSSLHAYFQHHKLKSMHNLIWQEATHYLGPKRLETFLRQFDAYSDGEMANIERVYELYPDAFYILNVRELDSWVKSRIKWLHRAYPNQVNGPMGQDYRALGDKAISTWVTRRNSYHQYVIDYFKKYNGNLLIVNICSDQDWVAKCDKFLGLTTGKEVDFHSNKQVYKQMSEEKKTFLDKHFVAAIEELKVICDAKEISQEKVLNSIEPLSDPYPIRVNLKHLVRKRFK